MTKQIALNGDVTAPYATRASLLRELLPPKSHTVRSPVASGEKIILNVSMKLCLPKKDPSLTDFLHMVSQEVN